MSRVTLVVVPWAGANAVPEGDAQALLLAAIEIDGEPIPADTEFVLRAADFIDDIDHRDITALEVRVEDRTL